MARGGKRAGSGRKRTSQTPEGILRRELALKALREGTTPLQVMLEAMKDAYEEGGAKAAMPFAKEAAPYLHPRLSSVEGNMAATLAYLPAAQSQQVPIEDREANPKLNGHTRQ